MHLNHLKELTDHWIQFQEQTGGGDLERFAKWVLASKPVQPAPETDVIRGSVVYQLGILFRFVMIWEKKAFEDLPVRGFNEFGALAAVEARGFPKKSEVIKALLLEPSTGFEILRKLSQEGFVQEVRDSEDQRAVRLKLSPLGRRVLGEVYVRVKSLSKLLTGHLRTEQLLELERQLLQLNKFHELLYQRHGQASWKALCEAEAL